MIRKLSNIINRLERLPERMPEIFAKSVERNKEFGADLITDQMSRGIDGTGEEITPEYRSDEYAAFKRAIGSLSSPTPDLKLTGDYHRSIDIKVQGIDASITSSDLKDEELSDKYGPIKQYSPDTKREFIEQITPDMKELIFRNVILGI